MATKARKQRLTYSMYRLDNCSSKLDPLSPDTVWIQGPEFDTESDAVKCAKMLGQTEDYKDWNFSVVKVVHQVADTPKSDRKLV